MEDDDRGRKKRPKYSNNPSDTPKDGHAFCRICNKMFPKEDLEEDRHLLAVIHCETFPVVFHVRAMTMGEVCPECSADFARHATREWDNHLRGLKNT